MNKRQLAKRFKCLDCKINTCDHEHYVVHDHVWDSVAGDGMLCVGCLESRLGRPLVTDDFADVPLNILPTWPRSERLSRLLAPKINAFKEWLATNPQK